VLGNEFIAIRQEETLEFFVQNKFVGISNGFLLIFLSGFQLRFDD
jgi:hypothetical protein